MTVRFFLRQVGREFRGAASRLAYFVACLAIGVAAVTAVASLSQSLDSGIRSEARDMIGADVVIDARQPLPPDVDAALAQIDGIRRTDTREQSAVIAAAAGPTAGRSVLSDLKIVDGEYPFYGTLKLDPPLPLERLLENDGVVVAPEILSRLGISIGNSVTIGGKRFRIAGVARQDPDRLTGFMYLGPRTYLSKAAFESTELANVASRVEYKALLKLPEGAAPGEAEQLTERLKEELKAHSFLDVESSTEGRPEMQRGIERLDRFLGLIALLSLLLGGVGVAQAVRTWISTRLDAIAILKCIGLRPREVLALYVGQSMLLGIIGSAIGVLIAVGVLALLPPLLVDIIPADLIDPWQPAALARGFALGVGVSLLFSVPPLIAVLRVPPSRVFRRDAEPLPEARWVPYATAGVLMIGVAIMAIVQADSPELGLQFTGGVLGTALVLALAAWGIAKGVGRVPRDFGRVWLRYGLAALGRPGASTVASMVGLGLGVMVLFATHQVQFHLNYQLESQIPGKAPSIFLADVRPEQWAGVERILSEAGATEVQMIPLVMARVAAINGTPIEELLQPDEGEYEGDAGEGRERRRRNRDIERMNRRDQFVTYLEKLGADNEIVEGEWWSDSERAELSIEDWLADDLELELGSTMTFETLDTKVEVVVTSIRKVEWRDFNINVPLVVEPGVLDDAPQMRIAAATLPEGADQVVQDQVIAAYPNVSFLQIGRVLDRVVVQLRRIGWGVRFLGLFILAAGLAVLTGTIGVESHRRGREVALLKTLGMTRAGVAGVFATEYALVGFAAGFIGIVGGAIVTRIAVVRGFEMDWLFRPGAYAAALFAAGAVAVIAGTGASVNALRRRPIEVLRHEE